MAEYETSDTTFVSSGWQGGGAAATPKGTEKIAAVILARCNKITRKIRRLARLGVSVSIVGGKFHWMVSYGR
ncbi:MAG: hypothetical protein WD738_09340, partial [Pirellulales bacterium]